MSRGHMYMYMSDRRAEPSVCNLGERRHISANLGRLRRAPKKMESPSLAKDSDSVPQQQGKP